MLGNFDGFLKNAGILKLILECLNFVLEIIYNSVYLAHYLGIDHELLSINLFSALKLFSVSKT